MLPDRAESMGAKYAALAPLRGVIPRDFSPERPGVHSVMCGSDTLVRPTNTVALYLLAFPARTGSLSNSPAGSALRFRRERSQFWNESM